MPSEHEPRDLNQPAVSFILLTWGICEFRHPLFRAEYVKGDFPARNSLLSSSSAIRRDDHALRNSVQNQTSTRDGSYGERIVESMDECDHTIGVMNSQAHSKECMH